jgi:hypothetical protein
MYTELSEPRMLPIGFARSLVWAVSVTLATSVVMQVPPAANQRGLAGLLTAAAMAYSFIAGQRIRDALRANLLVALLLLPLVLGTVQTTLVTLLATAVVLGLLRCWQYSPRRGAFDWNWRRECCCLAASLSFGTLMLGARPADQVFTTWGFCLGQLVSTLFVASAAWADCTIAT